MGATAIFFATTRQTSKKINLIQDVLSSSTNTRIIIKISQLFSGRVITLLIFGSGLTNHGISAQQKALAVVRNDKSKSQMKIKFETTLNTVNIIATLILGVVALIISINSYRLSERQTYLTERQNKLDEGQSKLELKNAALELINVSSMLRQTEKDYPNIQKCLDAFSEMKSILEGQLKNKLLFENTEMSDKWIELLGDINFNIKFFQPGTSPNVKIDGAYNKVKEFEQKSSQIFQLYK